MRLRLRLLRLAGKNGESLNRGGGQANLSGITHVLEELMVLQLLLLLISYM